VSSKPESRRKKVASRSTSSSKTHVPADVDKLYGDIMRLVENNGEVTLPPMPLFELSLTNRHIRTIGFLVATAALIALLKITRRWV
jgi:hypothetical protein